MPECHENTVGNKICQKFIEEQMAEDRTLADVHTDVTGKEPCLCANPTACPASQGHVHTLLSSYPALITGQEGTGLFPVMYSTSKSAVPIGHRGLVLLEAQIDARNYILRFEDNNKRECWFQVRENSKSLTICCWLRVLTSSNPLHTPSSRYTPRKTGMELLLKSIRM